MDAFLSEPAKIQAAVAGLVALTAGYYAAKGSLAIMFRFVEARLGEYWESHIYLSNFLYQCIQIGYFFIVVEISWLAFSSQPIIKACKVWEHIYFVY